MYVNKHTLVLYVLTISVGCFYTLEEKHMVYHKHTHTDMQANTASHLCIFIKFVVGPHLVTRTQRTKGSGGGGCVRYGNLILCRILLMCVCTRQASVTYNWSVSGADMGSGFSPPTTRTACSLWLVESVCQHLYLLWGWPRGFGTMTALWGTNDSQDCHESRRNILQTRSVSFAAASTLPSSV